MEIINKIIANIGILFFKSIESWFVECVCVWTNNGYRIESTCSSTIRFFATNNQSLLNIFHLYIFMAIKI